MVLDDFIQSVVVVDDTEREVAGLLSTFEKRGWRSEFIKVDFSNVNIEESINTVKLLFLDLNYDTGIGSQFDPYFCANIVKKIVPKEKEYYLVAWTKDVDKVDSVIDILRQINMMPIKYTGKLKEGYRIGDEEYDVDRLLLDIESDFNKVIQKDEFFGEIIEIEEESVLINCMLDQENGIFQVRRFDLTPFKGYIGLIVGEILLITIVTKPGSRIIEFFNESIDKKKLFDKPNYFDGLDNTKFFKER